MANLQRIVNVTNLDLETNKDHDSDKPAEASFVAVTYTLGGTGAAPQAEKDGGSKSAPDAKVRPRVARRCMAPPPSPPAGRRRRRDTRRLPVSERGFLGARCCCRPRWLWRCCCCRGRLRPRPVST